MHVCGFKKVQIDVCAYVGVSMSESFQGYSMTIQICTQRNKEYVWGGGRSEGGWDLLWANGN